MLFDIILIKILQLYALAYKTEINLETPTTLSGKYSLQKAPNDANEITFIPSFRV
jgi:hypothetical protein